MKSSSRGVLASTREWLRAGSLVSVAVATVAMVAGLVVLSAPAGAAAGDYWKITTGPATSTTAGVAQTIVATAYTDSGFTTPDTTNTDSVTLSTTPSLSGSEISGNTVSAVNGVATFSLKIDVAGSYTALEVSDNTDHTAHSYTDTTNYAITPNTASALAFTQEPPTDATQSVALSSFKVSVEDAYGNVVSSGAGSNDTIVVTSACTLGGTTSVVAAAGVATFTNVSFTSVGTCSLTANTSPTSLTAAVSTAVVVASTTPTQVGFKTEPATTASSGTTIPLFTVAVEESNGLTVTSTTGYNDTIAVTSTCKLTGTTSAVAIAGIATFNNLIIETAGPCTLVATDSSRTLATATSTSIAVAPGAPTQLAFTTAPPATVLTAGTVLTAFKVSVEDFYDNVVTSGVGTSDTVTITSPCTLGGTTSVTAVAGVATFSALSINVVGSCVLTATDTSRSVTAATATTVVGEPQATLVVTTHLGYLDAPLTLATSGGTGSGAVTFTVTNGTATGCTISGSVLTATKAGTCVVTATKAASAPYAPAVSAATTVTISSAPKALRVLGVIANLKTSTVRITGYNFSGRPQILSNVAGFSAKVTHDTGKLLTVIIQVTGVTKPGVKVMTLIFAHGRTSVKYSLH